MGREATQVESLSTVCEVPHQIAPPPHLVDGLETALLAAALDPVVGPEVLHILQHELDPGGNFALLDDLSHPDEVLINELLREVHDQ